MRTNPGRHPTKGSTSFPPSPPPPPPSQPNGCLVCSILMLPPVQFSCFVCRRSRAALLADSQGLSRCHRCRELKDLTCRTGRLVKTVSGCLNKTDLFPIWGKIRGRVHPKAGKTPTGVYGCFKTQMKMENMFPSRILNKFGV